MLGPLELDGTTSTLGLRDRVVLEALAVRPGAVVRAESLAEAIWGETPPPSWPKVVQGCVSRLRKTLGSDVIETAEHGYRLRVHVDHLDHLRFERLVGRARELLTLGEPERASLPPAGGPGPVAGRALHRAQRVGPRAASSSSAWSSCTVTPRSCTSRRCCGPGATRSCSGPPVRLVQEAPFRERRWGLLALAQYQDGRQREALDTLHRARAVMVNELGLDPGPDLIALEQAILRQDPSLAVQAALPEPSADCPYPGLVAYDIRDAGSFFGRESDIEACLGHLDAGGALAIVGASGSGKSSLARAGVAAALERDGRRVRVMTPGRHPMDVLGGMTQRRGDVLVVDQCEEVLAPEVDPAERAAFLAALADIAGRGPLILTLRADRLGEVSRYPAFAHLVERGLHLLGPMEADALRRAIEGPAEQAGLRLEPGLVDLLVREVEGAPGALPLLSHVLRQTWTRREGSTLTVAGYTATGGIQEAVSQSAETVFRGMTARQQDMLRDLMLRLVVPSDSGDPVRTRAPRRSVAADEEHEAVIESLVGARLLSSDGDTVEIAHEALAARLATPAVLARRRRRGPADHAPPRRGGRQLGGARPAARRALPRAPPGQGRAVAHRKHPHPHPDRARLPRRVRGAGRGRGASHRGAGAPGTSLQPTAAGRTRRGGRPAGRRHRRRRPGQDRRRPAPSRAESALVADARRLGAEALRSSAPDLALLLAVAGTRSTTPPTRGTTSARSSTAAPELIGVTKVHRSDRGACDPTGEPWP